VLIDPDAPRSVSAQQREALRAFLEQTLPDLADAELVYTRL
jgi:hypothetical protein